MSNTIIIRVYIHRIERDYYLRMIVWYSKQVAKLAFFCFFASNQISHLYIKCFVPFVCKIGRAHV